MKKKPKPKAGKIIRKPCLRCGKEFGTENRFNRICPTCSKLNERAFSAPNRIGGGACRQNGRSVEGRGD